MPVISNSRTPTEKVSEFLDHHLKASYVEWTILNERLTIF